MLTVARDSRGMSRYLRFYACGATYFFTVNLARAGRDALTAHADALRASFAEVLRERPVQIDALVVLPDHLHAVWTLPEGDQDFSTRWKRIKAGFTRSTGLSGARSLSKELKGERGVWQRRFWEHRIRDQADFAAHVAYCWDNPVRHGYVARPEEWPFSSLHRDIRLGRVPSQWSAPVNGAFGE